MISFAVSRKTSGPMIPALFTVNFYRNGFIFTDLTVVSVITFVCLMYSFLHWLRDTYQFFENRTQYYSLVDFEKATGRDTTIERKLYSYKDGFGVNTFWLFFVLVIYAYILVGLAI